MTSVARESAKKVPRPGDDLFERESELALLDGFAARIGSDAGVVLVEGPAGIGKTALLAAARAAAERAGAAVLFARASALERDLPFGLVRQLFEAPLARMPDAERDEVFDGAASLARGLVAPDPAGDTAPDQDAAAVLHGLYWVTANLARTSPLALVVDDLHWADDASLRFLAYLGARLDGLPAGCLLATRSDEPTAERRLVAHVAAAAWTETVRPRALSPEASARLLREEIGVAVEDAFADACHAAAGGNPFLTRALARHVREEGIAPTAQQAGGVRDLGVAAIARAVFLRLLRLPDAAAGVARAVAILGDDAPIEDVVRLSGLGLKEVEQASDELAAAQVLSDDRPLSFVHPLVRTAIYRDISHTARGEAHRRAAELLAEQAADDRRVATHLMQAPAVGQRWALDALRGAAREAMAQGAPDGASAYLRRARDEPLDPAERGVVVHELGLAEVATRGPDAIGFLREAMAGEADPTARARIALEAGRVLGMTGYHHEAAEVFRSGLDPAALEPDLEIRLQGELAVQSCLAASRAIEPPEYANGGPGTEGAGGLGGAIVSACRAAGVAFVGGRADEAVELAERALAGGELLGELHSAMPSAAILALLVADRLEQCGNIADAIIGEARRTGSTVLLVNGYTLRASIGLRRGALAAAEADARFAGEITAQRDLRRGLQWSLSTLVETLVERGDLAGATAAAQQRSPRDEDRDQWQTVSLRFARARLLLAQGRAREALDRAREVGQVLERGGMRNPAAIPWRSAAALAHLGLGDRSAARGLAADEVDLARAFGAPSPLGRALRILGRTGTRGSSLDAFEEAVAVLADSPAELERAYAVVDLGAARRRAGHRGEARDRLREGFDLARRCDARPLAALARDELVAAGAKPRRLAFSGVASLTASERRVAELAARGMSNREIAQTVFVTEKTVEAHLSHVYRKLDINSRTALPDSLG